MRAFSAQDKLLWDRQHLAVYLRIDAQDTGGTWRDLTARRGYNMVKQGTVSASPDQPAATFTAKLKREVFALSLAPYMSGSILNTLGGGTWLLHPNANVRAYIQVRPAGMPPDQTGHSGDDGNAGAWNIVFDGQIDSPDSGADPMTISCSDLVTRLQRAWIKQEAIYGVWQATRWTRANTVVVASANATNGANNIDATTGPYWQAQFDFTTTTTEPAWPASPTVGTLVADGSNANAWKCVAGPTGTPADVHIQTLIDDNLGHGAMTLYVPTAMSPVTVINPYVQKGMSLFQAIQNVCNVNGWIVSWKYTTSQRKWDGTTDSSGSAYKLCFFDPLRSNVTSAFTIAKDHYQPVTSFKQDLTNVRNDVDVVYYDRGTLDASGNPTATTVNSQDAGSIALYGDLYCQVAEGAASQITDSTAAQALADAVRKDLAQAPIDCQLVLPAAWWFEPTDVVTVSANGVQFDQDKVLAVYTTQLDVSDQACTLTLGLRQSPASGVKRWQGVLAGPGRNGGAIKQLNPHGVTSISVNPSIRGARVKWAIPSAKQESYRCTEVHVGTAANFVPSAATLKGTSSSGYMLLGDLGYGSTLYVKLIHKDRRDRRGPTSNSTAFVPDQVHAADLGPELTQNGKIPIFVSGNKVNSGAIRIDTPIYAGSGLTIVASGGGSIFNGFELATSCSSVRVHAKIAVRTGDSTVMLGAGGQLYVYDATASAVLAVGTWCYANVDSAGNAALTIEIDETVAITAGNQIQVRLNGVTGDGSSFIDYLVATPNLSSTPFVPLSFVEVQCLPVN